MSGGGSGVKEREREGRRGVCGSRKEGERGEDPQDHLFALENKTKDSRFFGSVLHEISYKNE